MRLQNNSVIPRELPWHSLEAKKILGELKTNVQSGLSDEEHTERLEQFGLNTLEEKKEFRFWKLLFSQLKSPLIFILIIAGIVTLILREYTDTIVIFLAVGINTIVGVYQEGRAGKAFEKLRESLKKYAVVIRGGQQKRVEAQTLVPGDIIILQSGDQVPADIRLIEAKGVQINEAILTGEWLPVGKNTDVIQEEKRITEQFNMAWMGTNVDEGLVKGVVVGTGENTEFGKIAGLLQKVRERPTPFQKGVKRLARVIGIVILLVIIGIFILGMLKGGSLTEMFLISVALAVAAIPEGLPVAVTVILAISMSRILSKGGLVKRLPSAETLGGATVIITDKTGTLTEAKMKVAGTLTAKEAIYKQKMTTIEKQLLKIGVLSSSAFIENPLDEMKEWKIRGTPTEKALLEGAVAEGLHPETISQKQQRIDFLPFDAENRLSASLNIIIDPEDLPFKKDDHIIYVLGAPEVIIELAPKWTDERFHPKAFSESEKKEAEKAYTKLAGQGMRILAVAYQKNDSDELPRKNIHGALDNLVFVGLIALRDPIREDVPAAIEETKEAGIRSIMVTGDNPKTALAVAREVGLAENSRVILGEDLEKMDEKELQEVLYKHSVFARVLPHQKKAIVDAFHRHDEVIAMTGDGVNDAPALRAADIGIALNSGTDVAKEAGDIVLIKDSFRVIVEAIKEGRVVIDNLRKVVTYLLSTGFGEVILIGGGLLLGFGLPILPAQILWANIIGEGFMNFALAFEPGERDIIKRRPEEYSSKKIITPEMSFMIFGIGIITSILLVLLLIFLSKIGYSIEHIRTILFAGLVMDSLFFVFALKSFRKQIWNINLFSNKYLIFAFLINSVLLIGALTLPPLQTLLHTITPTIADWGIILGLGIANLFLIELAKGYYIHKQGKLKVVS